MKDIESLFSDLYDLQRLGVVDTRLIVDDGEVSLSEVQHFVDVLYGRHETCDISNKHYTVIVDTGVPD